MHAHRHRKLTTRAGAALAVVGAGLYLAAGTLGASSEPTGAVHVLVTPSLTGHGGTILITGAIGDYGKTFKADANGSPDPHGSYSVAELHRGTILLNTGTLMKSIAVGTERAHVDLATCSLAGTVTAGVPIVSGTGLYSGISGGLRASFTLGEVGTTYARGPKKGQCNQSAGPVAQWAAIVAAGTIS
jgi:hypothetical protein